MRSALLLLLSLCCLSAGFAQDCFSWDGKVSGNPVRLILDTGYGAGEIFVYRSLAERLGLKRQGPEVRNAQGIVGWPTEAVVELPEWVGHKPVRIGGQMGVYDPPGTLRRVANVDGGVGWPLIRQRITRFDARAGKFHFLNKVPKEAQTWTKFPLLEGQTEGEVLALEVPDRNGGDGVIFIDTGSVGEGGVDLSARKWVEWKARNPKAAKGFIYTSRLSGLNMSEAAWADKILIGGLEFSDIIVAQTDQPQDSFSPKELFAVLRFQALKHLDLIVDGERRVAYLRPVKVLAPAPSFLGGRGGALFAAGKSQPGDLVAHVVDGSPAFDAGIRNGDILSEIDNHSLTQWLSNPGQNWSVDPLTGSLMASSNALAGANIELTLKRGEQTFETAVLQRDIVILPPSEKH